MTTPIKIDIWSDVACPWCYIGKRKLESGMNTYEEGDVSIPIEIEYHSFELAPDTPLDFEGNELEFVVSQRGMTPAQIAPTLQRITDIAATVGLDFDFDSLRHTNTVLALQLVHYAMAHDKQSEVQERLLSAYFVEGRHVGRIDDLADLGAEVGLDREDVIRSLTEGEYLGHVRADQARAQEYGITGVPYFVVDGKYGVSGAQNADTFVDLFRTITAERLEAADA